MNIETQISKSLWEAIQASYSARNFTASVIDAIFYLSNMIRERSGLESDGAALVGAAFGGKNPKLKVNKLQTESDWNVQKGVEQLLRGIYQGLRNPRSHEKYNDSQEDADSIIVFVNYLLKVTSESKPPFTKQAFFEKIFDPYFPSDTRYAELLVGQIPAKYRLDILIDTFKSRSRGDAKKLKVFFSTLLGKLKADEIKQLTDIISSDLAQITEESLIREAIKILPETFWSKLDEAVRIRTEHILANSIESGQYDVISEICTSGALGTWATSLIAHFISKDTVLLSLIMKLKSEDYMQQDYVFQFFFYTMTYLINEDDWLFAVLCPVIKDGLKEGDIRFYNAIKATMNLKENPYKTELQDSFDNFQEKNSLPEPPSPTGKESDDLPF